MPLKQRLAASARAFMNPALRQPRALPSPEPARVVVDRLLAGKNALVTGAGRNIGRAIALEIAAHGGSVYCTERVGERAAELATELAAAGVPSKVFEADITKPGDSEAVQAELAAAGVGIDVVVNNVGIVEGEPRDVFETNVLGPMHLTRLFTQSMIEGARPGSVVFVSSIHQQTVVRRSPAYSASKGALAMLIKELAVELAPHRIRVNGVAPGWTLEDSDGSPVAHGWAPLEGTSVPPRYIGRAAVHLASDHFSRYTTGTTVTIDGGLSLFNYLCAVEAGLHL